jgi:hypothetical protein
MSAWCRDGKKWANRPFQIKWSWHEWHRDGKNWWTLLFKYDVGMSGIGMGKTGEPSFSNMTLAWVVSGWENLVIPPSQVSVDLAELETKIFFRRVDAIKRWHTGSAGEDWILHWRSSNSIDERAPYKIMYPENKYSLRNYRYIIILKPHMQGLINQITAGHNVILLCNHLTIRYSYMYITLYDLYSISVATVATAQDTAFATLEYTLFQFNAIIQCSTFLYFITRFWTEQHFVDYTFVHLISFVRPVFTTPWLIPNQKLIVYSMLWIKG